MSAQPNPIVGCHQPKLRYLTLAFAFLRSAQYFLIRTEVALRAAADHCLVRLRAVFTVRPTARRPFEIASSGKVRSIAIISARNCFKVASAPLLAISLNRSTLNPLCPFGINSSN
jgi:hypothetical protein